MHNSIKLTDILFGNIVKIIIQTETPKAGNMKDIYGGVVLTKYIHEYTEQLTFNDCIKIAKENGFVKGTFLIISETPMGGIIYQYANYKEEPYICEYGTTHGYA